MKSQKKLTTLHVESWVFFCRKFTLFFVVNFRTLLSHYLCYSTRSTRIALVHFRHWTTHPHLHVESLILLSLAYQPHCSVSVRTKWIFPEVIVLSHTPSTKTTLRPSQRQTRRGRLDPATPTRPGQPQTSSTTQGVSHALHLLLPILTLSYRYTANNEHIQPCQRTKGDPY